MTNGQTTTQGPQTDESSRPRNAATTSTNAAASPVEAIKRASRYLRGTLAQSLEDPLTGALRSDDTHLCKFHGVYQQDDRDVREERQGQKLEPLYSFMARVRIAGGVITPEQWISLDRLSQTYANGTLRITTRQTVQFHGVVKRDLRTALQDIHRALLTTMAACGDVNRNVMCTANPHLSPVHEQAMSLARELTSVFLPRTDAYHEIWIDGQRAVPENEPGRAERAEHAEHEQEEEPLYGRTYLPRKFKIAVAVPPDNDVDLFTNDLGFAAVVQGERLVGFDVFVGGGMGRSHGDKTTYPRLSSPLGYCEASQAVAVAKAVLEVQRDHGDRRERHHARLKYTIDRHGMDWFREQVEAKLGTRLPAPKGVKFSTMGDRFGWTEDRRGLLNWTIRVPSGRVSDAHGVRLLTALRELAKVHEGEFRLTGNQNIVVCGIRPDRRSEVERLLLEHGVDCDKLRTGLRLHSLSCVALPTCGLAMAEAERYLPSLLDRLDAVVKDLGLAQEPITIRMTGCPNGCARPYNAEIALVGRAPGRYDLYWGAGFAGDRLNRLHRENLDEAQILEQLVPLLRRYATDRDPGEHLGDFVRRTTPSNAESRANPDSRAV